MPKRQAHEHLQESLHPVHPPKQAKLRAGPERGDQRPSTPADVQQQHVAQASNRGSAPQCRISQYISLQASSQEERNGNNVGPRASETAPDTKEEATTKRRATWRQQVREASTSSQDFVKATAVS
jgi:hypothetical protein